MVTTDLFNNISDFGEPEADFATRASGAILAGQISIEKGSTDPFSADTDEDGMYRMVGRFGSLAGMFSAMDGHSIHSNQSIGGLTLMMMV